MESRTFGTWLRQTLGSLGGAMQRRGPTSARPLVGMQVTTLDGTVLGTVSALWLGTAATDHVKHEDTLGVERPGQGGTGMLFVPSTAISRVTGQDIALSVDHAQVTARSWQYRPAWLPKDAPGAPGSAGTP